MLPPPDGKRKIYTVYWPCLPPLAYAQDRSNDTVRKLPQRHGIRYLRQSDLETLVQPYDVAWNFQYRDESDEGESERDSDSEDEEWEGYGPITRRERFGSILPRPDLLFPQEFEFWNVKKVMRKLEILPRGMTMQQCLSTLINAEMALVMTPSGRPFFRLTDLDQSVPIFDRNGSASSCYNYQIGNQKTALSPSATPILTPSASGPEFSRDHPLQVDQVIARKPWTWIWASLLCLVLSFSWSG